MTRPLGIAMLAGALLLAGCGDGDDDAATGTGTGTGTATGTATGDRAAPPVSLPGTVANRGIRGVIRSGAQLEMELDDFYFAPTFVKADPGTRITLELFNEGTVQHTFTAAGLGLDLVLSAGDRQEAEVQMPASGGAAFRCRFHTDQGMQGAFYSEEGASVTPAGEGAGPVPGY